MSAHRFLFVIIPSIEYGREVWEGNIHSLKFILDEAKWILVCSSKICNEAVRGDMGLNTLQSCRDRTKIKWCISVLHCLTIDILSKCLIEGAILNHVEESREKCGIRWWMIPLNL